MAAWLDLVVKTSALVLAAAMVIGLMRRASAASRHLVWTGMFVAALCLPVARFALPVLSIPVWPAADAPAPSLPSVSLGELPPAPAPLGSAVEPNIPSTLELQRDAPSTAGSTWKPQLTVLTIWLVGAALFVMRMGAGAIGVRRAAGRADRVTEPAMLARLAHIRNEFGVRRPIALLQSTRSTMPTTWGLVKPAILLPQSMVESHRESRDQIDAVLVHEVAHIARFDALSQWIARLAVAVWWFNPLFWIAMREARFERECACDDAVLTHGSRASDYAGQLIAIARSLRAAPGTSFGAIAMARASELEHRVRAILETRTNRSRRSRLSLLATFALIAAMLPMSAIRLVARAALTPPPAASAAVVDDSVPSLPIAVSPLVPVAPPQVSTQQPASSTGPLGWPEERLRMLIQLYGLAAKYFSDVAKMVEIGTQVATDKAPLKDALQNAELFLKVEQETRRSIPSESDKQAIRARFMAATGELARLKVFFNNGLITSKDLADALNAALDTLKEPGNNTPPVHVQFVTRSGTNTIGPIAQQLESARQELAALLVSRKDDNPEVQRWRRIVAGLEKQAFEEAHRTPGASSAVSLAPDADVIAGIRAASSITPDAARADELIAIARAYRFTPEMVTLYVAAADSIASATERKRVYDQPIKIKGR